MKNLTIIVLFILFFAVTGFACSDNNQSSKLNNKNIMEKISDTINIYDVKVKSISGEDISLSNYKGKVLMIVNVASKCGYTPQYEGLEAIYKKYKDRGFEILAFPCNDFKGQEPGTNEEIAEFCRVNYGVTFTLFDKIKVLGDEKSELYSKLIQYKPAGDIGWNFEKFIIDRNGNVAGRFKTKVKPESEEITSLIESELNKQNTEDSDATDSK
jgi:glutathione peroxidase